MVSITTYIPTLETKYKENRIAYFYHGKNCVTAGIYGKKVLGLQFHPEKISVKRPNSNQELFQLNGTQKINSCGSN